MTWSTCACLGKKYKNGQHHQQANVAKSLCDAKEYSEVDHITARKLSVLSTLEGKEQCPKKNSPIYDISHGKLWYYQGCECTKENQW